MTHQSQQLLVTQAHSTVSYTHICGMGSCRGGAHGQEAANTNNRKKAHKETWHDGYSKQEGAEGNMAGVFHLWVSCQRHAEDVICVDL